MRIRIIDAFARGPFTGNPAGVVLLDADTWPDESWMQQVAMEMNQAETAFSYPIDDDGQWALRWFTPAAEVDLCGHATLATAHAMNESGLVNGPLRFQTRSGELRAEVLADGRITLDFPVNPPVATDIPDGLDQALGVSVVAAYETGALGDLVAEVADEQTVRNIAPNMLLLEKFPYRGIIVTGAADEPDGEYQFVSRFFGPIVGVSEDPVTGSAHTALGPLWSARLTAMKQPHTPLCGWQASARGGLVQIELRDNRCFLTGGAITVLDGLLLTD